MATLTELIESLTATVTGFGASIEAKLTELNAARDVANTAAAEVATAVANMGSTTATTTAYIDALNGDDANDGLTVATAVKTWETGVAIFHASKANRIYLLSDLTADYVVFLQQVGSKIDIRGRISDDSGLQQRKLTFVDAVNSAGWAGGLFSESSVVLRTQSVDIEMAHNSVHSPLRVSDGRLEVQIATCTLTRTGTGAALFKALSGHISVAGFTLDPSAAGHFINGVGAGIDPNSIDGISANFTSA